MIFMRRFAIAPSAKALSREPQEPSTVRRVCSEVGNQKKSQTPDSAKKCRLHFILARRKEIDHVSELTAEELNQELKDAAAEYAALPGYLTLQAKGLALEHVGKDIVKHAAACGVNGKPVTDVTLPISIRASSRFGTAAEIKRLRSCNCRDSANTFLRARGATGSTALCQSGFAPLRISARGSDAT